MKGLAMKRYSVIPVTLYRFQPKQLPTLREKSLQMKKGQTSFDFTLGPNKLYNPTEGDFYLGPNGLSLRPIGVNLAEFLSMFNGGFIYELQENVTIPDHFVLIHERSDHYSLQTKQPIDPKKFCERAMEFFKSQKRVTSAQLKEKVIKHFEQQQ